MNRRLPSGLLLGALCLLTGCIFTQATEGTGLAAEPIDQIVVGTSTRADVTRLLGAPDEVVQLTNRSAWHYQHLHEKQSALFLLVFAARGVDTQVDRVWVFFDEDDVVTHVGSSFRADQAEFGLPPK